VSDACEFTRRIEIGRLPRETAVYDIAATAVERAALMRRFDLVALDQLEATVRIERLPGGFIRLSARLKAALVQPCVVTLDPVSSRIDEAFTVLYGPPAEVGDVVLDGAAEPIEPLEGEVIDIGEAVAQQLSLALDPFPRSAGALPSSDDLSGTGIVAESPFAVLAKLRKNQDS
jgi:uncharacterized metal-binding protein YceD (DUF177 family)